MGDVHRRDPCGQGLGEFMLVVGIALLVGAFMFVYGAWRRYQVTSSRGPHWKDGQPPTVDCEVVFCDWMITFVLMFVLFGTFNCWYWVYAADDPDCSKPLQD